MVRWSKELMGRVEGCSLEAAVVRPKVEVKRLLEEANKRNEATNIFCKKNQRRKPINLAAFYLVVSTHRCAFLQGIIQF